MITFTLDQMTEAPLRIAAAELGIADAQTLSKPELIAAIKSKFPPDTALVLAPVVAPEPKPWRSPAVVVSVLALVVAISAAIATWWGTLTAVHKVQQEFDKETKLAWQGVRVYDIVSRGTLAQEKWTGLTFDEIKAKYSEEVLAEKDILLGKAELQPDELKRVLQDLQYRGLLQVTTDNKYIVVRVQALSKDCFNRPNSQVVQLMILRLLATDSGKLTIDKLGSRINTEHKISVEDVYATANCMKATGAIHIDAKGFIWSALEAPKADIPNPMPEKK